MSRNQILCRLRLRQVRERTPLPEGLPDFPITGDLVGEFRRQAEAVGGVFHDGRSIESLAGALTGILQAAEADHLTWEGSTVLERHSLPFTWAAGPVASPAILTSRHQDRVVRLPFQLAEGPRHRSALEQVPISISSAAFGIAETGTLVESTRLAGSRLLPVLAPIHVCLLSERVLVANHRDFFSQPGAVGPDSSAHLLMTGPSRTADIEKTLVIGVHGPRQLHIILTD